MSILSTTKPTLESLLGDLKIYRDQPVMMQRVMLTHLENMQEGNIDIADGNNPFIAIMDMSTAATANSVYESRVVTRKNYKSLVDNPTDLLSHLSEDDQVDVYAQPGQQTFSFMIMISSLQNEMIFDPVENCHKIELSRNFMVDVKGIVFTSEYPIIIKRYGEDIYKVKYNNDLISPIKEPESLYIASDIIQDNVSKWLLFKIPLLQTKILTQHFTAHSSSLFKYNVEFTDLFFTARVYMNNGTRWVELKTVYSDWVYDYKTPTALLNVVGNSLEVFIPPIFVDTDQILGQIRLDIYTTKGDIKTRLSNYNIQDFKLINETPDKNDYSIYTSAFDNLSYVIASNGEIFGGRNGLDFSSLKDRAIENSLQRNLPITNNNIEKAIEDYGFNLTKDVDVVTNRIMLASKDLPNPTVKKLITPAGITVEPLLITLTELDDVYGCYITDNTAMLSSKLIYKKQGKYLIPLTKSELIATQNPVTAIEFVKNTELFWCPFWTILDTSFEEFETRSYFMDKPSIINKQYIYDNEEFSRTVITKEYGIELTDYGFTIVILVTGDNEWKERNNNEVMLVHKDNTTNKFYQLRGDYKGKDSEGNSIYQFKIETDFDINSNDYLTVKNFEYNGLKSDINLNISDKLSVLHLYQGNQKDIYNDKIDKTDLDESYYTITEELLMYQLGTRLKTLWNKSKSYMDESSYKQYESTVFDVYKEDVYEKDMCTNTGFSIIDDELVYNIVHKKGDFKLDTNGNKVIKHNIGDYVIENNVYVLKDKINITREIELVVIDGLYKVATDSVHEQYRKEISNIISNWCLNDMTEMNKNLLEKTSIYYYPRKVLGNTSIKIGNDKIKTINSKQQLKVTFYVKPIIYEDLSVQETIKNTTTVLISAELQKQFISKNIIQNKITNVLGDALIDVTIENIGGDNLQNLQLTDLTQGLSLDKKLILQSDNTTIVKEDVEYVFIKLD